MSRSQRQKGARIEREIVEAHRAFGVKAERYPLSGSTRFRGQGHDIDVYAFGPDAEPATTEAKGRKTGSGFALLERWLGDYDALFLKRNRADPLVVLPWRMWKRLLLITSQHDQTDHTTTKSGRPAQPPQGAQQTTETAMSQENQRGWPYARRSDGTERRSPTGFFQVPDVIERSNRSLAGPLRLGTAPGVGPRGAIRNGTSDFGMDRVTPRGFDPMGTSLQREPRQEGSDLVSRQVRRARRGED